MTGLTPCTARYVCPAHAAADRWRYLDGAIPSQRVRHVMPEPAMVRASAKGPSECGLVALSHADALPLLAARAHARGRRLFWFATRPPAIECEWTDGFLSTLPPVVSEWEVQNGDRM